MIRTPYEEKLHPRGFHGRWVTKPKIPHTKSRRARAIADKLLANRPVSPAEVQALRNEMTGAGSSVEDVHQKFEDLRKKLGMPPTKRAPVRLPKKTPARRPPAADWGKVDIDKLDNPADIAKVIGARHPEWKVTLPKGSDVEVAREWVRTIEDISDRYPQINLTAVGFKKIRSIDTFGECMSNPLMTGEAGKAQVYLNTIADDRILYPSIMDSRIPAVVKDELGEWKYRNKEWLEAQWKHNVDTGFHHGPADNATRAIATHEMGHALDAAGRQEARKEVTSIIKRVYKEQTGKEFGDTESYKWLHANTSKGSWGRAKRGYEQLSNAEILAESFADVELNGDEASPVSHALHDLLVHWATVITTPIGTPTPGRSRPQIDIARETTGLTVLDKTAYDIARAKGGVTIDLEGHQPVAGYAYAPSKTTELKIPLDKFTPEDIDAFIDAHYGELSQKGNHLGLWTEDGNMVLDVSRVGPAGAETIVEAQKADQLAVYDLGAPDGVAEVNIGTVDAGGYHPIDEAARIHLEHQGKVQGAVKGRGAGGVPEVPAGGAGGRTGEVKPLESINPTGSLFVDYDPYSRTGPLGLGVVTLDKASGSSPDEMITIYRGAPKDQKSIVPGDFVTTDPQLAKDYAGTGHVIQMDVPMRDVVTDPDEWEGGEHIYSPQATKPGGYTVPAHDLIDDHSHEPPDDDPELLKFEAELRREFKAVPRDVIDGGTTWYEKRRAWISMLSEKYPEFDDATIAAIAAAFSPQMDWDGNVIHAMNFIRLLHEKRTDDEVRSAFGKLKSPGNPQGSQAMSSNVDRALRVARVGLAGGDAIHALRGSTQQEILENAKIWNFARNMMGDHEATTIDRWAVTGVLADKSRDAADVYLNPTVKTATEVELAAVSGKAKLNELILRRYYRIAKAYRVVAKENGLHPEQFQAIIWGTVREGGFTPKPRYKPIYIGGEVASGWENYGKL